MFSLLKSLTYYESATSANLLLFRRLRNDLGRIGFSEGEKDFLEDIAIENRQFLDQAEVYSQVLSGMMDARASIINNNLNVMMKNMNAIAIAIAVPTFFASVGGMSEFTSAMTGVNPYLSYGIFIVLMLVLGVVTFLITKMFARRSR